MKVCYAGYWKDCTFFTVMVVVRLGHVCAVAKLNSGNIYNSSKKTKMLGKQMNICMSAYSDCLWHTLNCCPSPQVISLYMKETSPLRTQDDQMWCDVGSLLLKHA